MGLPKVTFVSFGANVASSRLRAEIPQAELAKLGIEQGSDILVYGKHLLNGVPKWVTRVYDVCDDHFNHPELGDYYRKHVDEADAVTCNSEEMARVISRETGRETTVIPDPYESKERPAGMGEGVLWFGHESNAKNILPYMDLNPAILTGNEWSREKQLDALERCAVVLLPTDHRRAKSANRLIESVRNGRFVVCGDLPAHDEFADLMWVGGDLREGVKWAQENRQEAIGLTKACQDQIREKYSPEVIAKQWLGVLENVWQQTTRH